MRLKQLTVENWGPHKRLTCDLDSPIVGIIGANGKGKSMILQAIAYAITGQLPLSKEHYIREYDPEDPVRKKTKASVALTFHANGLEGTVTRTISGSTTSRKLVYGDDTFTKQKEVDSKMEELLGADNATLQNAVFIKQGELTNLIQETPAVRQAIFRKLMNLSFMDSRYDDVQSKLRLFEKAIPDRTEELATLETKKQELTPQLEEAIAKKKALEWVKPAGTTFEQILWKRRDVKEATFNLKNAKDRITQITSSLTQLKAALDSENLEAATKKLEQATKAVERKREAEQIQSQLSNIQSAEEENARIDAALKMNPPEQLEAIIVYTEKLFTRNKAIEQVKELSRLVVEIETQRTKCEETDKAIEVLIDEADRKVRSLENEESEIKQIDDFLSTGDISNLSVCPVCGNPMSLSHLYKKFDVVEGSPVSQLKAEVKLKLSNLKDSLASVRSDITMNRHKQRSNKDTLEKCIREQAMKSVELSTQQADAHTDIGTEPDGPLPETEEQLEGLRTNLQSLKELAKQRKDTSFMKPEQLREKLKTLTDLLPENKNLGELLEEKDACQEKVVSIQSDIARQKQLTEDLLTVSDQLEQLQTEATEANTQLTQLEDELRKIVPAELMPADMEDMEAVIKTGRENANTAHSDVVTLQTTLDVYEKQITGIREQMERDKKVVALREELKVVKAMLSNDGLPAVFMQDVFTTITAKIQSLLELMGANFRVVVNEAQLCSFNFINEEGYQMPQESMSGGQAVRLALALLLASQQIILPDVGLLILDEPSSHVDANGVSAMCRLFQNLTSVLQNAGMQLIVVDHNEDLQAGFVKSVVL